LVSTGIGIPIRQLTNSPIRELNISPVGGAGQSARLYTLTFNSLAAVLLADIQAHYGIPGELFEGGQLYLVVSPRP
jgi:hypothetical protein